MSSIVLINGMIARLLGIDALGHYLLIRRFSYSIMGLLILGANISLPYHISKDEDSSYGKYLWALYLFLTAPLILISMYAIKIGVMPGIDKSMNIIIGVYLAGITMQGLCYALYRGGFNMIGANIFQILSVGIIPIIVVSLSSDMSAAILRIGTVLLANSLLFIVARERRVRQTRYYSHRMKSILVYGIVRVPGQIAQFVLIALIPLLIANEIDISGVAYFNTSFSILRIFLFVISPLGLVLLPRISKLVSCGQLHRIEEALKILIASAIIIGILLSLFMYRNLDMIVTVWLGQSMPPNYGSIKLLMFTIPFFLLSGMLRSPIDALRKSGYNSVINTSAAIFMILVFLSLRYYEYGSLFSGTISVISGYATASILSVLVCSNIFKDLFNIRSIIFDTLVVLTPYLLFIIISSRFNFIDGIISTLIELVVVSSILVSYFLFSQSTWIVSLKRYIKGSAGQQGNV